MAVMFSFSNDQFHIRWTYVAFENKPTKKTGGDRAPVPLHRPIFSVMVKRSF